MTLAALRATVKAIALRALGSPARVGLRVAAIRRSGAATVLNLHRVAPDDRSAYPPLNPELFDYLLGFVKQHFEPVTIAELGSRTHWAKPPIVLSFDDAYRDFAEHAVPLLERHGVRANQNIIPECAETGLPPLNVLMQDFIGRAPLELIERLEVPGFAIERQVGSRAQLGSRLSAFLKNKPIAEQKEIGAALREQVARDSDFAPTPMMSPEEIRQIAGVHELGGHSFSHANMALESDEYLVNDVARCQAWFRDRLGVPMTIYAVPNGSYRAGQIDLLREAGVEHVLLVDEDFSNPAAHVHRRFTFDGRSRAEIRFRAVGALRPVRARAA